MKKISLFVFAALFSAQVFAQAPESFNYQSVVRNGSGTILANQNVSFRFSILAGGAAGTPVYVETQSMMTNAFGLVNLHIGQGTVVSGSVAAIDWSANSHYLQVELDPAGGSTYTNMGSSQMLSVPYALHAKTVEIDNVDDADADPANEIQTLSISGTSVNISSGNAVDIAAIIPPSTVTRLTNLNDVDRDIVSAGTWTQASPSFTFTKNNGETMLDARLHARVGVGTFSGGSTVIFAFVIDGNTAAAFNGSVFSMHTSNSVDYISYSSLLDGISAGSHTIAIYGYTYSGTVDDIIFDYSGVGGCIQLKESW